MDRLMCVLKKERKATVEK